MVSLSAIALEQTNPTNTTIKKVKKFLYYAASHKDLIVMYHASDMILECHINSSYLIKPKAIIRAGGHLLLLDNNETPRNNGTVLNISQMIKMVILLAAEVKIGAMYINCHEALPQRIELIEMGHPQPSMTMQTENSDAHSVVTNNFHTRIAKLIEMQFHWMRCRDTQGSFRYYWILGKQKSDDYWKKHHTLSHHIAKRWEVFTPTCQLELLRGAKALTLKRCDQKYQYHSEGVLY